MNYTIPKPAFPVAAYLLGTLVATGLIGLGIAAFSAFSFIGRPVQAFAFALIIEAGMIGESLALIRRNWLAIPGLIVSLLVSGMYNYTQAEQAGALLIHPITNPWHLAALSIGPLSAVFFLALSLGFELRTHEARLRDWESKRQQWTDDQAERTARREERREARREKLAAATHAMTVTPPVIIGDAGSYDDFVSVMAGRNGSGPLTATEVVTRFGVSERTAWRWLARWKESHQPAEIGMN